MHHSPAGSLALSGSVFYIALAAIQNEILKQKTIKQIKCIFALAIGRKETPSGCGLFL